MKTLTRSDPWREIEDMFDRHSRAMGHFPPASWETLTADWAPVVDIAETDEAFLIKAEVPEVRKEDVKVTVDNGVLTIQGKRKQEKEEKGRKFHRIERSYGSFTRSFTLPDNVDEEHILAEFKDGMLNVRIGKVALARSKVIDVEVK
jgi:HSP20 family protein